MNTLIDATPLVEQIMDKALQRGASDIHWEPTESGYDIRFRVDGLLETFQQIPLPVGRNSVGRLMVLSHLLTYRLDIPQEGRIRWITEDSSLDLRLAIMPTTCGMRAVVRLPSELHQPRNLQGLGVSNPVLTCLEQFLLADSGMLIVTGPAGSGKTTTIYALLDYFAQTQPDKSIISLEDPVERRLSGITQIEVSPFGELTYERALKSILRQDPQVLALGEIRDAATARLAVQAALSGHRLICTLHAATVGGAVARLLEMDIEPYQVTSAVWGVLTQRLLRKTAHSGRYSGRTAVAEVGIMDHDLRRSVLAKSDLETLEIVVSRQSGYATMRSAAMDLVTQGITDEAEIRRVFGDSVKNRQDDSGN